MNDTSPMIAEMFRQNLLARSGAERIGMGSRMFGVDSCDFVDPSYFRRQKTIHEFTRNTFKNLSKHKS